MQNLEALRNKIDTIDAAIVEKLAERQKIVLEIGRLKSISGIAVLDVDRERQLLAKYVSLSQQYRLPLEFVRQIFSLIIEYSRSLQTPT